MKLTIAFVLAGLLLLAVGAEGLYRVTAQQTVLSCDTLLAQPARASWVKLSGCQLGEDLHHTEAGGRFSELLFPVRRAGASSSEPALMVAVTRSPEALAIAEGTIGNGQQPNEEARTVMMLRLATVLDATPDIQGFVRRSWLDLPGRRQAEGAVSVPLAPGAEVLELNERPGVVLPAVVAGAGAALLVLGLARLLRREPMPHGEAPSTVIPSLTDSVRISGLMLLNLSLTDGREAIEQAPPLGPREEVEEAIARALAGVTFDERGLGTMVSEAGSVKIDLGPDPVAWTAILSAQGRGVRGVVRTLVAETGWRIYYPKRGAFVDVDDLELL